MNLVDKLRNWKADVSSISPSSEQNGGFGVPLLDEAWQGKIHQ